MKKVENFIKEYLQEQGFPDSKTGSPKQILKTAFESGLIEDEQNWLNALADRKNVAHAYNEDIALGIINNTKECYYKLFEKLRDKLKE